MKFDVTQSKSDDKGPTLVIHKDTESRVCFMATPGSHGDPSMIEADARLIAAAPDLLAALTRTLKFIRLGNHPNAGDMLEQAEAAIAKATQG